MGRIYIKQGDTEPYIRAQLRRTNAEGTALEVVNLAGATIKFIMRASGAAVAAINATLAGTEIVDAANGEVQYEWETGDTDVTGSFLAEFEVTFSSGNILTFWDLRTLADVNIGSVPEPLTIEIAEDLG